MAINGTCAAYWAREWWRNRKGKRRKRALAAIGEKSRAIRDALVANMPQPQGSRS